MNVWLKKGTFAVSLEWVSGTELLEERRETAEIVYPQMQIKYLEVGIRSLILATGVGSCSCVSVEPVR